jgi:hypothetical protein
MTLKALSWLVYAVFVFAAIVLGFAFFLLAFEANPDVPFAAFIFENAARFMGPFAGLIAPTELESGGVIAWSMLFAIVVYCVAMWAVGAFVDWVGRRYAVASRANTPEGR